MTDWTQSALVYDNERHLAEGRGTYDKSGNIIVYRFKLILGTFISI